MYYAAVFDVSCFTCCWNCFLFYLLRELFLVLPAAGTVSWSAQSCWQCFSSWQAPRPTPPSPSPLSPTWNIAWRDSWSTLLTQHNHLWEINSLNATIKANYFQTLCTKSQSGFFTVVLESIFCNKYTFQFLFPKLNMVKWIIG